jgi:prefoldin beta subunit
MNISKEQENKISELQMIEQNMQHLLLQKQRFQTEQIEIENALTELKKTSSNPYKIVNNIMFEANNEELQKELTSKKEVTDIRIKNIEKQEKETREKAGHLQKEVMKELKNDKKQ